MTPLRVCTNLAKLELRQWQRAIAVLWYYDEKQPDVVMSAGQLAKICTRLDSGCRTRPGSERTFKNLV